MFFGRESNERAELIWPYAVPIFAAALAFGAVNFLTDGIFIFLEIGIAIGVFVFFWRLMRR
jgi:hypothetical protein